MGALVEKDTYRGGGRRDDGDFTNMWSQRAA